MATTGHTIAWEEGGDIVNAEVFLDLVLVETATSGVVMVVAATDIVNSTPPPSH